MAQTLESKIIAELRNIAGQDGVAVGDDELLVYECDAMTTHRSRPLAVVFPRTTEQVSRTVK
ncbi:MAG: FAD-binding oxidoreductase, partial [Blastocatellia bacterium]